MKKYFITVEHSHKYGNSYFYAFSDEKIEDSEDNVNKMVELFGIDFEPEHDEAISIQTVLSSEIKTI